MPSELIALLPHVNATLNSTAFVLVLSGLIAVKRGRVALHKKCMLLAACVSLAFLVCYVTRYAATGHTEFRGNPSLKPVYLVILVSHTFLAIVQVPLIVLTIRAGLTDRIDRHRKLARVTAPIWLYVSITGVVVYVFLYHLGR